jgi:hypothetical protein
VQITVTATPVRRRTATRAWNATRYTCTGPDGTVFDQHNKATLTGLLRQRYGRDVELTFQPPAGAR